MPIGAVVRVTRFTNPGFEPSPSVLKAERSGRMTYTGYQLLYE